MKTNVCKFNVLTLLSIENEQNGCKNNVREKNSWKFEHEIIISLEVAFLTNKTVT